MIFYHVVFLSILFIIEYSFNLSFSFSILLFILLYRTSHVFINLCYIILYSTQLYSYSTFILCIIFGCAWFSARLSLDCFRFFLRSPPCLHACLALCFNSLCDFAFFLEHNMIIFITFFRPLPSASFYYFLPPSPSPKNMLPPSSGSFRFMSKTSVRATTTGFGLFLKTIHRDVAGCQRRLYTFEWGIPWVRLAPGGSFLLWVFHFAVRLIS